MLFYPLGGASISRTDTCGQANIAFTGFVSLSLQLRRDFGCKSVISYLFYSPAGVHQEYKVGMYAQLHVRSIRILLTHHRDENLGVQL